MASPGWNQDELQRWIDVKLKTVQAEINKYIQAETARAVKQEVNAKISIFAEHSREAIPDEIRREDGMPQRVLRKMVELEARKLGHDGKDNNTGSSNDNNNINSSRLATISAEMARNTQVQKKLRQRMDATERAVAKLRKQEAQGDSGQEKVAFAMLDGPGEAEIHALRRENEKIQEEMGLLRQVNGQLEQDIRHLEKRDTQRAAQIEEMMAQDPQRAARFEKVMQLLSQAELALGN